MRRITGKTMMPWVERLNRITGVSHEFLHYNLISPDGRTILGFTPKAGCTVVVQLFFKELNRLDEACAYSEWIHDFREHDQHTYRWSPALHWTRSTTKIKFVRNPLTRLVSAYNHAAMKPTIFPHFERELGIEKREDATFLGLLEWLEASVEHEGWKGIDPHFWPQVTPEEQSGRYPYDRYVPMESLPQGWEEIRELLGWSTRADDQLFSSVHHRTRRKTELDAVWNRPFHEVAPGTGRHRPLPEYFEFYNPELIERVARLYAEDFALLPYSAAL